LWVLGAASFFEGYDFFIVSVALPQIRETFDLTQAEASFWLSFLFLGALPAVFVSRRADLLGRRRLLIFSILGYTLATGATALAPTIGWFVSLQFCARLFLMAEAALAWTMVAEELPAGARGFGFGWLAMLTALGSGLGALLYGAVLAPLEISWRWLYVAGIPPLLLIAFFRRRLPESRRFTLAVEGGGLAARWSEILRRPHRRWIVLACITSLLGALTAQAGIFTIDFMETDRGLSPSAANLILIASGALAIPVLVWSGALSDRFGRKTVGCSFAALQIVAGLSFFFLAREPFWLFVTLAFTFVGDFGSWPTLSAYSAELFPTRLRTLGGSWTRVFRVAGQFISLSLGSVLIVTVGGLSRTVAILGIGPLLTIFVYLIWFPETKGRELEEITGEVPLVAPL
jgi:putative MFS transporter